MSYRCSVCNKIVKPGVAQRRHVVVRRVPAQAGRNLHPRSSPVANDTITDHPTRLEVAAELPVCERCDWRLRLGASLAELRKEFAEAVHVYTPPPLVLQPVPEPPAEPVGFRGRKVIGNWRAKNQSIAVTVNNTNNERSK